MSKKKIRICITSFAAYSLFTPEYHATTHAHGGAELESYTLAHALSNIGHDVHCVVGDFGQAAVVNVNKIKIWKGIGTKKKNGIVFRIKNTLFLFSLWKKINADIYFTKGAGWLPFQLAIFCKLFKKKCILKISSKKNIDLSLNKKGYHYFYRWALQHASAVVVQNKEDIHLLKQNYNVIGKVIKNYHIIPQDNTHVYDKDQYFLWVGRVLPIKRPELFVSLAKCLPNSTCIMIASHSADEELWQRVHEDAQAVPNLKIIDNVPHPDMELYYQNALLCVNTSEKEGFPNTFIEAMRVGTPIASLSVNPDQCITEHSLGIFGEGNFELFIEKLRHAAQTPSIVKTDSQNAFAYAKKEFGDRVIDQWSTLLESIK